MVVDATRWAPAETGGILMGYWAGPGEVIVTDMVDAGPRATHTASGFTPDAEHQERLVAEIYERSRRLHTYLGDWHTHPAGGLSLSRTDRKTAARIARANEARCPRPLMMVLARLDDVWRLGAWVTQTSGWRRAALTPTSLQTYP